MKAAITGANGFIGSHLARNLAARHADIKCIVRKSADTARLAGLPAHIHRIDPGDSDALGRAVFDCDYVFHVAGLTRSRSEKEYMAANAGQTGTLVDACLNSGARLKRFVYVSSLAAVGPAPGSGPVDDTTQPRPEDHYGASKLAGERIITANSGRLAATIIRPPAVFGPGDPNLLPLLRATGLLHAVPIITPPSAMLTFVDVRDLVAGMADAALSESSAGQTYFIGSGTIAMSDIAVAIADAMRIKRRFLRIPSLFARLAGEFGELKWTVTGRPQILSRRKIRNMLHANWTCDWSKAERELGYRPSFGVTETMRDAVRAYAELGLL